jgi:hypothetical protein
MGIGMGLAEVSVGYQAPKQGKVFRQYLPLLPRPVQLLEIKTANQTIRFPDELLTLAALDVRRGEIFAKEQAWSQGISDEVWLKHAPAFKLKGISARPYLEIDVGQANDWLRGVTFKLKNVSEKAIVRIDLYLVFPETTSTGLQMAYSIVQGLRPGVENARGDPLLVKPGDEFSITVDERRYEGLIKFVEPRHPLSSINIAEVRIGFVYFDDNTGWGGCIITDKILIIRPSTFLLILSRRATERLGG